MRFTRASIFTYLLSAVAVLTIACGALDDGEDEPRELSPEQTAAILELLLDNDEQAGPLNAALDDIVEANDTRFVAVLIELQRAGPSQLAAWDRRFADVLNELTGEIFGASWDQWVEWYGRSDLEPPPGFAEWKGRILSGIDPRFTDFLYAGVPSTIRIEQIAWGGVQVDGITTLDQPPVLTAATATYLDPGEPVFGVISNGEARAYPLRIMDPHELVNDTLGGVPISLAYCTLCGTGIAYDARRADGTVHTFGTSGLLFQSNKLMYDHQTGSLWNQFTGRPVVGPLVAQLGNDSSGPVLSTPAAGDHHLGSRGRHPIRTPPCWTSTPARASATPSATPTSTTSPRANSGSPSPTAASSSARRNGSSGSTSPATRRHTPSARSSSRTRCSTTPSAARISR